MISALAVLGLFAAELSIPPRPEVQAARTAEPPRLDGRLDDAVWASAPVSSGFTQKFPDEGRSPTEGTSVRVLYDDDALYVGISCDQVNVPFVPRLSRRDRELETDRVVVSIDSRRDGVTAFDFGVTATGVLSDGLRYDDTEYNADWDEHWEARTSVEPTRWTVEMRIPLRVLRFAPEPVQAWGFNVTRSITARQEVAEWAYVPRTDAGVVSRYGRLSGLSGLAPAQHLDLRPFVIGRFTHQQPGYGPRQGGWTTGSAGLDARWHPGSNLTLDLALNPDFGQVEADQVVLNLNNVETEYPEKRPFFLEGTDMFATSAQVLYTRRIGQVPDDPERLEGERLADLPGPSPIWGAAKLVGRLGSRWGIGAISAITGRNQVPVDLASGLRLQREADPTTLFHVVRAKREMEGNGHLGVIATATNRLERPRLYPRMGDGPAVCPGGGDEVTPGERCFADAYVGGVDGRWRSGSGSYVVAGQALASQLMQGPPRQMRDGTVIGPEQPGALLELGVAKEGGNLLAELDGEIITRKFEMNDLGYLERQNLANIGGTLAYRTRAPFWRTLETDTELDLEYTNSLDGVPLDRGIELQTEWLFTNFWSVVLKGNLDRPVFDDREVGDGTALEIGRRWGGEARFSTDPRRAFSGMLGGSAYRRGDGTHLGAEAKLRLRVIPELDLDLEPEARVRRGEPRFVEATAAAAGTTYLFGRLDARSAGATLRATYTFTPTLTLQSYAQLFLVSKRYDQFSSITSSAVRPRLRLRDLIPAAAPAEDPSGQEGILNVHVVLRWEYRLGSTAYLVYSRAQEPSYDLLPGQRPHLDLGAARRGPAAQTLLLKLSYFWI